MIALVTGGAGFIGSHMVDLLLEQGHQVRVVDDFSRGSEENLAHHRASGKLSIERRDIRELNEKDRVFSGVDWVFHFAGIGDIVPSVEHPTQYMSVNVQGTVKVVEAARHNGVKKLIYAASSSCYGLVESTPTAESAPIQPTYPYALSKFQGEQIVLHWGRVYGVPVASMRIFNAYGTRARTSGAYGAVFGVFLKQKLEGRPFTVVGDGSQKRDFVYVTDVARAFLAAAEKGESGGIYNVGTGHPQSIARLVELLGGPVVNLPKRPGEPDCTWADISRIQGRLEWGPVVAFEDGVGKMLKSIESWRGAPLWDASSIEAATRGWFKYLSGGSG